MSTMFLTARPAEKLDLALHLPQMDADVLDEVRQYLVGLLNAGVEVDAAALVAIDRELADRRAR